jgi:putative transposase
VIWQILGDNKRENVQRDSLNYTGQKVLRKLREMSSPYVNSLHVGAKDRKYQAWQRNALSFPLVSDGFIDQKFIYIHANPVKAGLCTYPWECNIRVLIFIAEDKSSRVADSVGETCV